MTFYKLYRKNRKKKKDFFRRNACLGGACVCIPGTWAFVLLLLLLLSSACAPSIPYSQESPIEPVVTGLENTGGDMLLRGRFSVMNPEMKIYALALSGSGKEILFSSDARSVNMLDNQGRLKWEAAFQGLPVVAELDANGYYIAVGTDQGKVYFLHYNGRTSWEKSFEGVVEQMALSRDSECLAVSIKEGNSAYKLYLFDQWGTLLWEKETGPLLQLDLLSEDKLYYLEKGPEGNSLAALKNGEILWTEKASAADISGNGEFAVIYSGNVLYFYNLEPKGETSPLLMWRHSLSTEISSLNLTEKGEHILAYSSFPGVGSNLFLFHKDGFLLWEKKIPSGAYIQTSRYGERIVASSWQEYSEDFSRVLVLDRDGHTLQEIEMASRIEKIALSSDGNILALAGNEGNIFILDMPAADFSQEIETGEDLEQGKELYRPVTFTKSGEELYLTLYFYDDYALHLVPVSRSVKTTDQVLQAAVNELVKGPRRLSGLSRTIPKDAGIKVIFEDGIALIDLPEELNRLGDSRQVTGIIDSLVLTASQFSSVEGIRFLVEGKKAQAFGAGGFMINGVFPSRPPAKSKTMLYLPYRSGERYFLLPREAVRLGNKYNTPEDLLRILLAESRRFLPLVPEPRTIKVMREEIILDWDSSFIKLFPPEGSLEEKALATLFLDSILLTLGSNFQLNSIVLYVEGEPWKPPFGYPSPVLEFKYPFYINPE